MLFYIWSIIVKQQLLSCSHTAVSDMINMNYLHYIYYRTLKGKTIFFNSKYIYSNFWGPSPSLVISKHPYILSFTILHLQKSQKGHEKQHNYINYIWHVTHDMWHVTCDMRHLTWHWGSKFSKNKLPISLGDKWSILWVKVTAVNQNIL